jgi:hypothetical protein
MMAGTVTISEITFPVVKKITFSWASSSTGAADGTTTAAFDGKLIDFMTIPSTAAAPTDDYDIVINDADGHDVLFGAGADRDTANTEFVQSTSLGSVAGSKLTLAVTNAGASKAGTAVVWIR